MEDIFWGVQLRFWNLLSTKNLAHTSGCGILNFYKDFFLRQLQLSSAWDDENLYDAES